MIRTEKAFQEALKRLEENQKIIDAQKAELERLGVAREDVERTMAPLLSFNEQIRNEVSQYERIKQSDFSDFLKVEDLGKLLIAMRIAKEVTQRELAERLGVSEALVSRDERNEYYRASPDRIQQVLQALGAEVNLSIPGSQGVIKDFVTY